MTKKNGDVCCITSCRRSRRLDEGVKLFNFPANDIAIGQIWREKCNITTCKSEKKLKICDKHFAPSDIGRRYLKKGAEPIYFLDGLNEENDYDFAEDLTIPDMNESVTGTESCSNCEKQRKCAEFYKKKFYKTASEIAKLKKKLKWLQKKLISKGSLDNAVENDTNICRNSKIFDTSKKNNSQPVTAAPTSNVSEVFCQIPITADTSASLITETQPPLIQSKIKQPVGKQNISSTQGAVAFSTGISEQKISCHLCQRNFFTKEYLNKHLFEIHDQELECSKKVLNKLDIAEMNNTNKHNNDDNCNSLTVNNFCINSEIEFENYMKIEPADTNISEQSYFTEESQRVVEDNPDVISTEKDNNTDIDTLGKYNGKENDENDTIGAIGVDDYISLKCKEETANDNLTCYESYTDEIHRNKTELKKERYSCHKCNQQFTEEATFKQHISQNCTNINNIRTYICLICGKAFKRNDSLLNHIKRHNNIKQHKCQHCTKRFLRAYDLKKHERHHAGKKLYQCKRCDKRFIWACKLKTHLRTHMDARPFKCE